jgi:hypothetical protein
VGDALQGAVRPLAQRHPVALVLTALVVGGLLVSGRAWRWILTPTLLAGLLPQLLSKAIAGVPTASWMAMLAALTQGREGGVVPPPGSPAQPDSPPSARH